MRISFDKYPITIIIALVLTFIELIIILFGITGEIRIILGLPIILFIPGWVIVYALFPTKKTDKGIDNVERIALSFGLSLAIVPLIGLILNYTTWGIRIIPIILSLVIFIFLFGLVAIYRWYHTPKDTRYTITINISIPKGKNKIDTSLNLIIVFLIIISLSLLTYAIVSPKIGEKFTDFYLLGPNHIADDYPSYLNAGENASVIIGIINHEYKKINYTVEIWLINQTNKYNETKKINSTMINNMWFIDKITTTLNHSQVDLDQPWKPQWEKNFSFTINQYGSFKLAFLLYTKPTEEYNYTEDYKNIAKEKIENAYRNLHLWINVPNSIFYLHGPNGTTETYNRNLTKGENITGIIGIVNHEYKKINYTTEIWLVNQSTSYNETLQKNITTIQNLWFVDKITTTLNHTEKTIQWEQNYSFNITKTGSFKLAFLLFPLPTEGYIKGSDYIDRAEIKFKSAYKQQNIFININ